MFKKVLFLCFLVNLLCTIGCFRSTVVQSENDSSVLTVNTPKNATDIKLKFDYTPQDNTCNVDDMSPSDTSSLSVKIKNACIQKGEYTVKLSLKLDEKDYSGEEKINKNTEIKDHKISLNIVLSANDGSKIETNTDNEVDISGILAPEGFKYFGKKQQTITIYNLQTHKDETKTVIMYIFENVKSDLNCENIDKLSCTPRGLVSCNTPECDRINDPKTYGCIGSPLPDDGSNRFRTDYLCTVPKN